MLYGRNETDLLYVIEWAIKLDLEDLAKELKVWRHNIDWEVEEGADFIIERLVLTTPDNKECLAELE